MLMRTGQGHGGKVTALHTHSLEEALTVSVILTTAAQTREDTEQRDWLETCASSQDGWTGTTLNLLPETTKGGRQSTPDSSLETPDTRKDSGP